jgi:Calcineurin-like phosphoesterase
MQRTIVVGDVHGCREELELLVNKCGFVPGERLVLAGDLVAKGPDSAGVVARAREWGALGVLGNHDAHVLALRRTEMGELLAEPRDPKPEHKKVLDELGPKDWLYLEALPLFLRLGPEHPGEPETAVVHAGAVPGRKLEEQRRDHLITLRSIREDGEPTKKLKGTPWASLWTGPERLIFGHDAIRSLQQYPMAIGLDTGCVYGGKLTAIILPERRLVQVDAKRPYVKL